MGVIFRNQYTFVFIMYLDMQTIKLNNTEQQHVCRIRRYKN